MRTCSTCRIEKPDEEFHWKNRAKEVRNSQCKQCLVLYHAKWYVENKDKQLASNTRNKKRYSADLFEKLIEYLSTHPCVDCGEKDPVVLEFDHQRDKERSISYMIGNWSNWDRILVEIEKCEVRCCNCHRKRTAKQFGWKKAGLSSNAQDTGFLNQESQLDSE